MSAKRVPTMYAHAIGRELAAARIRADVPASILAEDLNVPVHDVMDVETGWMALSSTFLQVWCDRLGISAQCVLARAAKISAPGPRGLSIDLRSVSELNRRDGNWLIAMGTWARELLTQRDLPIVVLSEPEIERLAAQWRVRKDDLVEVLRDFVPLETDTASRLATEQYRKARGGVK